MLQVFGVPLERNVASNLKAQRYLQNKQLKFLIVAATSRTTTLVALRYE